MKETIAVSICCITYNHEKFIRDTLEGFLSQETNFAFEVLIHDDASTDKTQEIITEYAEKYPEVIKPIFQKENLRSKGISVQRTYNYPRIKGKYVAFCDGDDYWSDPLKLQMQYDALEKNKDCALCVHDIRCIKEDGTKRDTKLPKITIPEGVITDKEYIHMELGEGRWLFQTSSFFVRKNVIDDFLNYQHEYPYGDFPLVLFSLQYGNCWYIPREMSMYRQHPGGVLQKTARSLEASIKYTQRVIAGHKKFDEFTKGKYHEDFAFAIRNKEVHILKLQGAYREILKKKYRRNFKILGWKIKILICFGAVFPKTAFKLFCAIKKTK